MLPVCLTFQKTYFESKKTNSQIDEFCEPAQGYNVDGDSWIRQMCSSHDSVFLSQNHVLISQVVFELGDFEILT